MSTTTTELPGPGWYPDPADPQTNRYWDGSKWTESRAPITTASATTTEKRDTFEAVDGIGYALAVFLPLVGFIMGLVMLNKSKHGVWIVLTSVIMFIVWIAVVSADAELVPMTKEDALMVFDRLDEAEIECRIRARTVEYIDPDREIGQPMTPDIVREYSVEVEAKAINEPDLLRLVADQAQKYDAAIEGDFAALVLR